MVFIKILAVPNKQAFWSNEVLSSNPIFFTDVLKFLLIVPSDNWYDSYSFTVPDLPDFSFEVLIFLHFFLFLFKHSCVKGTSDIYYATRSLLLLQDYNVGSIVFKVMICLDPEVP